jgi:hypothetical protein
VQTIRAVIVHLRAGLEVHFADQLGQSQKALCQKEKDQFAPFSTLRQSGKKTHRLQKKHRMLICRASLLLEAKGFFYLLSRDGIVDYMADQMLYERIDPRAPVAIQIYAVKVALRARRSYLDICVYSMKIGI